MISVLWNLAQCQALELWQPKVWPWSPDQPIKGRVVDCILKVNGWLLDPSVVANSDLVVEVDSVSLGIVDLHSSQCIVLIHVEVVVLSAQLQPRCHPAHVHEKHNIVIWVVLAVFESVDVSKTIGVVRLPVVIQESSAGLALYHAQ